MILWLPIVNTYSGNIITTVQCLQRFAIYFDIFVTSPHLRTPKQQNYIQLLKGIDYQKWKFAYKPLTHPRYIWVCFFNRILALHYLLTNESSLENGLQDLHFGWKWRFEVKHVLMMNFDWWTNTNMFCITRCESMDWSHVDYLWIILMFLSAVWTLILTAPIQMM